MQISRGILKADMPDCLLESTWQRAEMTLDRKRRRRRKSQLKDLSFEEGREGERHISQWGA